MKIKILKIKKKGDAYAVLFETDYGFRAWLKTSKLRSEEEVLSKLERTYKKYKPKKETAGEDWVKKKFEGKEVDLDTHKVTDL